MDATDPTLSRSRRRHFAELWFRENQRDVQPGLGYREPQLTNRGRTLLDVEGLTATEPRTCPPARLLTLERLAKGVSTQLYDFENRRTQFVQGIFAKAIGARRVAAFDRRVEALPPPRNAAPGTVTSNCPNCGRWRERLSIFCHTLVALRHVGCAPASATQRQLAPLQAAVWPDSRARTVPPNFPQREQEAPAPLCERVRVRSQQAPVRRPPRGRSTPGTVTSNLSELRHYPVLSDLPQQLIVWPGIQASGTTRSARWNAPTTARMDPLVGATAPGASEEYVGHPN